MNIFGRNSSHFTFVSDAHSTTSWLDHIICDFNLFIILSDVCILDKLALICRTFCFSHSSICVHLSSPFTSMLIHVYLPASLMKSAIVPILKNSQGDTSDKNNYSSIAIGTAISKKKLTMPCESN